MSKPQLILTLEPLPCSVPVRIRVRQLLKTALRRDRLRCVRVNGDALDEPASDCLAGETKDK
jgi:hypothetical protein